MRRWIEHTWTNPASTIQCHSGILFFHLELFPSFLLLFSPFFPLPFPPFFYLKVNPKLCWTAGGSGGDDATVQREARGLARCSSWGWTERRLQPGSRRSSARFGPRWNGDRSAGAASKRRRTSAQLESAADSSKLCAAAGNGELSHNGSMGGRDAIPFFLFLYFSYGYNLLSIFS